MNGEIALPPAPRRNGLTRSNISAELSALFGAIADEVDDISWKWDIALDLYGDKKHVKLLSDTAPAFFSVCQELLVNGVLLGIVRLLDSPTSMKQKNVVMQRLIDATKMGYPVVGPDLDRFLRIAMAHSAAIIEHRHKRIAHNAFEYRIEPITKRLPSVLIGEVGIVVRCFKTIVTIFSERVLGREHSFHVIVDGGVEALIIYLQKGFDASEDERRRRIAGAYGRIEDQGPKKS